MGEVGQKLYLGNEPITLIQNNGFVYGNPYSEITGPQYQVRYDAFSDYIVVAQPMSLFSDLGMTNYYDSLDAEIRGTGTSLPINPSGSAAYYFPSASIVSSGSYDFSSQGYTTSVSHENSSNIGVIPTSAYNIGSQDFVVEFWFNPREAHANPPYHMWCFGSDISNDYITITYSFDNTFRFYINANNTWSTTPSFTDTLNTWYHVAFVKSGTNAYVYLNGNRIGVGTRAVTVNTPPNGFYSLVGINSGTNNDGLRKTVQDYKVYFGTDKGYRFSTIPVPESIVAPIQTSGVVEYGLKTYLDAGNASSYGGSGTTWYDLSGNGNNGTLVNSPSFTSGDSGYFQLNGTNQYIRLPKGLNQSGNTFMIIAKSTAGSKAHTTMMSTVLTGTTTSGIPYRDLAWDTTTVNTYSYITSPGAVSIAPSYNLNQWYSFAITEGNCIQNGFFDDTQTITDRSLDSAGSGDNQQIVVGTGYWGYSNMQVAAVLVYDRKLSNEEIQQNYDIFNARY